MTDNQTVTFVNGRGERITLPVISEFISEGKVYFVVPRMMGLYDSGLPFDIVANDDIEYVEWASTVYLREL